MSPRSLLIAMMAAALLAGAACGGGGGGQPRSEAGLKAAVREFTEAGFQGDYEKAYEGFARECREEVSLADFRASLSLAATFMEAFTGAKLSDIEVEDVLVRNYSDDGAEVAVVLKPPKELEELGFAEDEPEYAPWKWEDGRWVAADCSGLGQGDLIGGDPSSAPTVPPPGSGPALGDTVEAGDARITVRAVEDPARDISSEPDAGNRYVAFDITVEALGGDLLVSPSDFSVQDSEGFVYDAEFFGREPELSMTDLARGRQVRGWVTFQVPEDARLIALYADVDLLGPETMVVDLTRK